MHGVVLDGEEGGVLQQELPQPGLGAARDLPHLLREPPSAELAAQVVQTPEKKAGNNAGWTRRIEHRKLKFSKDMMF